MNREWHKKNPMPKNPTLAQRVSWHVVHKAECGCRKMPDSIAKLLEKRANQSRAVQESEA